MPSINEDFLTMAVNGVLDNCRFVVGPAKSERKPISIFVYENDVREEFKMIVFSAKNILCCLLLGKGFEYTMRIVQHDNSRSLFSIR